MKAVGAIFLGLGSYALTLSALVSLDEIRAVTVVGYTKNTFSMTAISILVGLLIGMGSYLLGCDHKK